VDIERFGGQTVGFLPDLRNFGIHALLASKFFSEWDEKWP
jgi:hypothetical protein